jgi:predicted DCC family thiol-disulfide oxidoreductase YuxK
MPKNELRPVVFYDGGCPLCRREIAHYQGLDRAGAVDWVDLLNAPERLRQAGISTAEAMARLHVLDTNGALVTGVMGFVTLWRRLPYYRHLASLVTGLRLVGPLDWAYRRFAARRFKHRCADGFCANG